MRLLNTSFEFCDFDDTPPPYAILSHTWSEKNEEEVTYQDLKDGTSKSKLKLELCRDWTKAAGHEYFWVDTCCIDKRNDAELGYAIRSMWRWYAEAGVCLVYLPDLSKKRKFYTNADWRDALKDCRWFTRGWTLQELVASGKVEFYARDGYLGSREDMLPALRSITGINLGGPLPDHATRLSWVTKRVTKRPEDKAYCMLGICDVSLDPRYGEGGHSAWRRLRNAITYQYGTIAQEVRNLESKEDRRKRILEALRFDGLETRRKTIQMALPKTCEWILGHSACAKWIKLEHRFFWIKGKPGAGKSVLIRYLDQHITQRLDNSHAIGLYFYFNARGGQLEKSLLGLYRSLLVQLVDIVPKLVHVLDALDTSFDLPQLQRVLTSAIYGHDRQIWLFIDALDECREGDVWELIDFLVGLQEAKLYVCVASRHYPIVQVPTNLQLVLEEVNEHRQDLSTYVEKLDFKGEELVQMQRDIVAKANGVFLWVVLVVGILQKDVQRARYHAMQSRLREIPEGLPELFKSIILRDDKHKEEFLLCLRWILYACRPLTLKEWYFAMMAGVNGPLEWVGGIADGQMKRFLLSSSKGLAELTKGKTITAQFIHESVRDFLIDQGGVGDICGGQESPYSIAHEQLKHCCLRGMTFDLPRQLKQRKNRKELFTEEARKSLKLRFPFAEYATMYVLQHANQAAFDICQRQFLINDFTSSDWTSRFNAFQKSKPSVYVVMPSLWYLCAERNLARLLARPTEALSPELQQRYGTPLSAAIVHSSWEVLRMFLNDMDIPNVDELMAEVGSKTKLLLSPRSLLNVPWRWAVMNDLEHLSKHLLKSAPEDQLKTQRDIALQDTSFRGYEKMVQMLIDAGADVDNRGGHYGSPLWTASSEGHEKVVRVLIDAGADVDAQGDDRETALQAASSRGYEKVVRLLIDAGADVNSQGGNRETALQAASSKGYEKVVQTLIDAGADVVTQGAKMSCALFAAIDKGHEKVVRILVDAGADVKAKKRGYSPALYAAVEGGCEKIVQILTEAGADINAQGGPFGNALQEALFYGNEQMVQMLIFFGADVNAAGRHGSALQTASESGHEKIVQMLIDAGANVNAQGIYGNALQAASESGHERIVQMLIDAGAVEESAESEEPEESEKSEGSD
jgi:ankyrin repeat protein